MFYNKEQNKGEENGMIGENNPTKQDTGFGGLSIRRLAPGDRSVQVEWELSKAHCTPVDAYIVRICCVEEELKLSARPAITLHAPAAARSVRVSDLFNGVDYAVAVSAMRGCKEAACSRTRLFRTGPVPGTVVAYLHPQDYTFDSSGRSPASPSLIRLPNGRLLASHDIFWPRGGQNITHIYASDDDGANWSFLTELTPCYWGKMFLHRGALFMLCTSTEYGDLQIYRSSDSGATFEGPFVLLKGDGRWGIPGPSRAPVPVVLHKGRLWSAVEYGCWKQGYHDAGVISAPECADLCDADSWTLSPFISYDPGWPGVIRGGNPSVLEGNVVPAPDGGLVNILRYQTGGGDPEYGKAILLRIDDEHPEKPQTFEACIDFPGNLSKFDICRDEQTGRYLSLVNRAHTPWYGQRNILSLSASDDLKKWNIVCDPINYEDKEWPEGALHVGFQYVDFFIEGPDLLFLSRTALNGAHNFHDANHITYHRIEDFRKLLG
jgi:hypothetical protein